MIFHQIPCIYMFFYDFSVEFPGGIPEVNENGLYNWYMLFFPVRLNLGFLKFRCQSLEGGPWIQLEMEREIT